MVSCRRTFLHVEPGVPRINRRGWARGLPQPIAGVVDRIGASPERGEAGLSYPQTPPGAGGFSFPAAAAANGRPPYVYPNSKLGQILAKLSAELALS